jgi:hypothetical protein
LVELAGTLHVPAVPTDEQIEAIEGGYVFEQAEERLRRRLQEYDDTLATPGQARDIADQDLIDDLRTIVNGGCGRTGCPDNSPHQHIEPR